MARIDEIAERVIERCRPAGGGQRENRVSPYGHSSLRPCALCIDTCVRGWKRLA